MQRTRSHHGTGRRRAGVVLRIGCVRSRRDVVMTLLRGRVMGVQVKPEHPASSWIWGCAAARRRALVGLEHEEWPGSFLDARCRAGVELHVTRLSDSWLDVGTRDALLRARSTAPAE